MASPLPDLAEEYTAALRDYLAEPSEAALHRAYEIGRRGHTNGVSILEMAAIHHDGLARICEARERESVQWVKGARNFLSESLAPFEMTHRAFHEANAALRRLNERLEEEAKRIAHSLHDEAGQILACVHIALAEVSRDLPPQTRVRLIEIKALLEQIEEHLRHLSHELRPTILDDLGLIPALEFLADGVSKRSGLPILVEGPRDGRLPFQVETAVYRAVQEALNNVTKHAKAMRAVIRIEREPRMIWCSIKDDGLGFDVPALAARKGERGIGLIGIQERVAVLGGMLQIQSEPGKGTELRINIPLED